MVLVIYIGGLVACLVSMLRNVKPTSALMLALCLMTAFLWPLALIVLVSVAGASFLAGEHDAASDDDDDDAVPPGAARGAA